MEAIDLERQTLEQQCVIQSDELKQLKKESRNTSSAHETLEDRIKELEMIGKEKDHSIAKMEDEEKAR